MMKNHPIKILIGQGEHQQLDFKYEISDAAKIARTLVSFANTDGGKLLIGVKDNGSIKGIASDEEIFMLENAALRFCQPEIKFSTKEWIVDGKKVLEVTIPADAEAIYRAPDPQDQYKAFVRVRDENFIANGVLMKVWKKRQQKKSIRISYTAVEEKILKYLHSHETISLSQIRELTGISKYKAEDLLSDMILLDLVKMEFIDQKVFYKIIEPSKNIEL